MNDEAVPTEGKGAATAGGGALTRKDLIERVQAITGAKPKDVRDVVEATLVVMGTAVRAGEVLRLPPFGIGRPRKPKEGALPESAMMLVKTSMAAPAEKAAKPAKEGAGPKGAGRGAGQGKGAGKKAKGVETPAASE